MNRRSSLHRLAAAAAGAAALAIDDPERLIWEPGKKTIFLPSENRMTVEAVTDTDIQQLASLDLGQLPPSLVKSLEDVQREMNAVQSDVLRNVRFRRGGYRVATSDGLAMRFDEQWLPTDGWRQGRPMSEAERVAEARRIFSRQPAGTPGLTPGRGERSRFTSLRDFADREVDDLRSKLKLT